MRARILRLMFSLLLIFSAAGPLCAQGTDEKLAAQYMDNGEYDKAASLYEKLLDKDPGSIWYYDHLLECLIRVPDFDAAQKLVKKRSRKFPSVALYGVDAGYLLDKQNKPEKATETYRDLIGSLKPSDADIRNLSDAFRKRGRADMAVEAFEKGRKLLASPEAYALELGELYLIVNRKDAALREFIGMVLSSDMNLEQVQDLLQSYLTDKEDLELLKNELLSKLQDNPDSWSLDELLKWVFIQQKDWESAFLQTRALDKKLKEDGRRVMDLAWLCVSNEEWGTAAKCFDYVKNLGQGKSYWFSARNGLLDARYRQLESGVSISEEDKIALEKDFLQFIEEEGTNAATAPAIRLLARFYIFHTHQPDKAISWLEKARNLPGMQPSLRAQIKMDLGDAYLASGDIWEPQLIYSQVEKELPDETAAQEAKYRNARLAYFRGEFEWAQTQLDVLKGATTKLISNDAIRLSLLIQDNTGLDSSEEAMRIYSRAELLIYQNRLSEAELLLDSIPLLYPQHSLNDEILFARAGMAENREQYAAAEKLYLSLVKDYATDILGDNALYRLGLLYEYKLSDKEKAIKAFENIILNYPGSLFISEARKHYRRLRGDKTDAADSSYYFGQ